MQIIVSSLKKSVFWVMRGMLGLAFTVLLLFAFYKPAHATEPKYGYPVQRVTVLGVTCTRVQDADKISFLITSSRVTDLTYNKISSCVEFVKKSKFILVDSNELNLTSRIAASFKDIQCLKTKKFVISFSGTTPLDLESKIESCFTRAQQIYDHKNNSLNWI